jgi:LysR family transcriptional regulator, benzoate and cis,cis-muconate-responsive activator of ben and cat genes
MLELRHLRYFVAVAEELNFSRAAERLHMAQPPLSVAIRRLEQDVGEDLFVRTTREVRLTEAGVVFLASARRVLADADRAIVDARRAAAGELGSLRVAFSWSARFETLPAIGQALRARTPDVELLTQEMWNADMASALRRGTIDAAVSLCPELAPDVGGEVIRIERPIAILPGHHALAHEAEIPVEALADEQLVLFPRELAPRLHDVLVGICRQAGFEPQLRTESFHTSWDLFLLPEVPVVALAPESVAGGLAEGVAAVALSGPIAGLETRLLWFGDEPAPMIEALRTAAHAVYGAAHSEGV